MDAARTCCALCSGCEIATLKVLEPVVNVHPPGTGPEVTVIPSAGSVLQAGTVQRPDLLCVSVLAFGSDMPVVEVRPLVRGDLELLDGGADGFLGQFDVNPPTCRWRHQSCTVYPPAKAPRRTPEGSPLSRHDTSAPSILTGSGVDWIWSGGLPNERSPSRTLTDAEQSEQCHRHRRSTGSCSCLWVRLGHL